MEHDQNWFETIHSKNPIWDLIETIGNENSQEGGDSFESETVHIAEK